MSTHLEWTTAADLATWWYSQEEATDPEDGFDAEGGDTPPEGVAILVTADGNGLAITGSVTTVAAQLRRMADLLESRAARS